MSIHNTISIKISTFLDNIYYNYLIKLYGNKEKNYKNNISSSLFSEDAVKENTEKSQNNDKCSSIMSTMNMKNTLNDILNNNKLFIIKPEYFIYLQYYFIYTFFHYITQHNTFLYSISLHFTYICELVFKNISIKHNYIEKNNTKFLINTSHFLLLYLFFFKIFFLKIYFYYKIFFLINFMIFYTLFNINDIYKQILECIDLNKEFYHPFKIIVLSPNKKFILNIINKTRFFTYSNFLIFINLLLFFIL